MVNPKRAIRYYTLWDGERKIGEEKEEVDHTRDEAKIMLVREDAAVWVEGTEDIEVFPLLDEEDDHEYVVALPVSWGGCQEFADVEDALKKAEEYVMSDTHSGAQVKLNKSWDRQVLERYLGLPPSSPGVPNSESWELRVVSLKRLASGNLAPKEAMQITTIDPTHVAGNDFEHSHLITKLPETIVCARMDCDGPGGRSELVAVETFDLDDEEMMRQVREDYELVRTTIIEKGFDALTGAMGVLIQPRTKGAGHGSISRAFYARTGFVKTILGLDDE